MRKPKALLHASASIFEATFINDELTYPIRYAIEGLVHHTIIGVNATERIHEQIVRTDVSVERYSKNQPVFGFSKLATVIGEVNCAHFCPIIYI